MAPSQVFVNSLLVLIFFCACLPSLSHGERIPITPEMLIRETNLADRNASPNARDETGLIDELVGGADPKLGTGGTPVTLWFPGWDGARYPASVIVDLGARYDLQEFYFYDAEGQGNFEVQAGTPFVWEHSFINPMNSWPPGWKSHAFAVRTRYLRLTVTNAGGSIPREIAIYGTLAPGESLGTTPTPAPRPRVTIDQLIGTNAFVDDPVGLIEASGNLREYHNWAWDEGDNLPAYPRNQNAWNPSWAGGGWDFDLLYRNLKKLGVTVSPCVQSSPNWATGSSNGEHKPVPQSAGVLTRDPTLPASYTEHADHLFQYAARYGNAAVDDTLLKLRSDQPRLTGAGVLTYFENWNEPDKGWEGRLGYFSPFELAAMSSADRDGHLETMGGEAGINSADPGARLVMGGLASLNLEHIRAIKFWGDHRRAGDFPFHAINLHHYSTDGGGQGGGASTVGVCPEQDGLRQRLEKIRDYRDRYLPGVEFWFSEFGYDRASGSDFRAPPIGNQTAEEVQARWIVRSWLEIAAAGVDRGYQFMLRDVYPSGHSSYNTRFSSCGLTGPKNDWTPRTAWFYQSTLRQRLRGLSYLDEIVLSASLRAYRFAGASGQPEALVVWRATQTDGTTPSVTIPLPSGTRSVSRVDLTPGDPDGVLTEMIPAGDAVVLDVSEKPVILLLNGKNAVSRPFDHLLAVSPSQVVDEAGSSQGWRLFDEPSRVGDPDFGKPSPTAPASSWVPGNYPSSSYVDLKVRRRVRKVYLYDINSNGPFSLAVGEPGRWREFSRDSLSRYGFWTAHANDQPSRYLRFTMESEEAHVAEVALYAERTSGYADWCQRRFGEAESMDSASVAPHQDPEGDGICNAFEYLFGGDPNLSDSSLLPQPGLSATQAAIEFPEDAWITDATMVVEWSNDLKTWRVDTLTKETTFSSADVRVVRYSLPLTAGQQSVFFRLRANITSIPESGNLSGGIAGPALAAHQPGIVVMDNILPRLLSPSVPHKVIP